MSDNQLKIIALIATVIVTPVVGLLIALARKRLGLSDETRDAVATVQPESIKPRSVDQALTILARRIDEQGQTIEQQGNVITAFAIYVPQVEAWGHRGWSKVEQLCDDSVESPPNRPERLKSI